jgi:hypothetical protein
MGFIFRRGDILTRGVSGSMATVSSGQICSDESIANLWDVWLCRVGDFSIGSTQCWVDGMRIVGVLIDDPDVNNVAISTGFFLFDFEVIFVQIGEKSSILGEILNT